MAKKSHSDSGKEEVKHLTPPVHLGDQDPWAATPSSAKEPGGPVTGSFLIPATQKDIKNVTAVIEAKTSRAWVPQSTQIVAYSSIIAGLMSVLDIVSIDNITTKTIVVAFGKGMVGWLATYLGLRSSGAQK